jgi:hypothetical protein
MFKLNKYHVFLYLPHGCVAVSYILPFYTTIPRSMIGKPEVQWIVRSVKLNSQIATLRWADVGLRACGLLARRRNLNLLFHADLPVGIDLDQPPKMCCTPGVFFNCCPAIFEVPLYLIIDRTSDSCDVNHEHEQLTFRPWSVWKCQLSGYCQQKACEITIDSYYMFITCQNYNIYWILTV